MQTFAEIAQKYYKKVLLQNKEMKELVFYCESHNIDAKLVYKEFQENVIEVNGKFINQLRDLIINS